MDSDDCITCYATVSGHVQGEEIETCHICLVANYEIDQIDSLNEILEDYEFFPGFCEQCVSECDTTKVILCHEHHC